MGEKVINYYYRPIKNLDTNVAEFCNVYQILPGNVNTTFLYPLLLDKSQLINLNEECFSSVSKQKKFLYEFEFVDNLSLCFSPCVEFLENEENYRHLLKALSDNGLKNSKTILFFDTADIFDKNKDFKIKKLKNLKSNGILIALGSYGKGVNLMDIFSECDFDYFIVNASYVFQSENNIVNSLNRFCLNAGIKLIVEETLNASILRKLKQNGVKFAAGDFVADAKEKINREFLGLKPLTPLEREKYFAKIKQEKVTLEQERLILDGKKLLRKAKHDAEYNEGDVIVAVPDKQIKIAPKAKALVDERAKLLKDGKLPESKSIKLDEFGKPILSEFENSIIETIYSLLADRSVKDKEQKILGELEEAKKRAKKKAEEEFILKQIELLAANAEKKKKELLYRMNFILNKRIEYLLELDILALEIEELELKKKIENEKAKKLEEERCAELKKKRLEEERVREAIRAYFKQKAILDAKAKERERLNAKETLNYKNTHQFDDSLYVPYNSDDIFVPAEIEEEVESSIYNEYYISEIDDSENAPSTVVDLTKKMSKKEKREEKKRLEIEKTLIFDKKEKNAKHKEIEKVNDINKPLIEKIIFDNSSTDEEIKESNEDKAQKEVLDNEQIVPIAESTAKLESQNVDINNAIVLDETQKEHFEVDLKANLDLQNSIVESMPYDLANGNADQETKGTQIVENEIGNKDVESLENSEENIELKQRVLDGGYDIDLSYDDGEGNYNDKNQWVASDGEMYNGYFDKKGRWIDYGYYDEEDNWTDNGFFDKKLNCFIPFGYFDDDGKYKRI